MDGIAVEHPDALGYRLSTKGIGKIANLEVLSRNQRRLLTVLLERAPAASASDEKEISGENPFSGAVISNLSPQLAEQLRMPPEREGVVVTKIKRGSPAMGVGIRPGDVIIELNGEAVADVSAMAAIVDAQPSYWSFKIDRGGRIIRQYFR